MKFLSLLESHKGIEGTAYSSLDFYHEDWSKISSEKYEPSYETAQNHIPWKPKFAWAER